MLAPKAVSESVYKTSPISKSDPLDLNTSQGKTEKVTQKSTQKPPLSSKSTPMFGNFVKNIVGHRMNEDGQIMLKIQYYYLEIALWETF